MIAFHEGEVSYKVNPRRGAQFYPNCVQIEVTGDGNVELPKDGVSFPGAYKYEDPGVVHNVSFFFLPSISALASSLHLSLVSLASLSTFSFIFH